MRAMRLRGQGGRSTSETEVVRIVPRAGLYDEVEQHGIAVQQDASTFEEREEL
jgi:hypothetical protein